jgi:uncharacterized protein
MTLDGRPVLDRGVELERLRALLRRLHAAPPAPRRPAAPGALPLERVLTPAGVALRRTEEVPWPVDWPTPAPPAGPGTVFLDTETTGLAGGTGTYVFLVGLATWAPPGLRVTQYFLGDLGAEAALLHAVGEAVGDARRLVTFNGRTFDLPLLETRYLLARTPWWGVDLPHLDLYPVARALWRQRASDCRLTTLEGAVLGLDRGDDLPGAVMPSLYFRWLRTQDPRALPRLFAHNRWDLVALAALHVRAETLLEGPGPGHHPLEWVGAGRWLERRDRGRAARFYEAALDGVLPAPARGRAAWRLGLLWRRAGRTEAARRLWSDMAGQGEVVPLGLLIDLAKLHEHHARDHAAALGVARMALARAEAAGLSTWRPEAMEAVRHRVRRLERRVAGLPAVGSRLAAGTRRREPP